MRAADLHKGFRSLQSAYIEQTGKDNARIDAQRRRMEEFEARFAKVDESDEEPETVQMDSERKRLRGAWASSKRLPRQKKEFYTANSRE